MSETDTADPRPETDSAAAADAGDAAAGEPRDTKALDRLAGFYRWNAKIYDYTRWAILRNRRRAFARLEVPAGGVVLDVGCGTGLNFKYIVRQQPGLGRLIGLDLSQDMLDVAQRKIDRFKPLRGKGETVQANAEDYTLDAQFEAHGRPDVITYAYSLSMIPDWEASLRCSWEHLKPGGRMMVLDFGDLRHWPWPIGKGFVGFLRANHVKHFGAPWESVLRDLTPHVEHKPVFGYYSVITYATKPDA